jgi:hypothetical protein
MIINGNAESYTQSAQASDEVQSVMNAEQSD